MRKGSFATAKRRGSFSAVGEREHNKKRKMRKDNEGKQIEDKKGKRNKGKERTKKRKLGVRVFNVSDEPPFELDPDDSLEDCILDFLPPDSPKKIEEPK
ncbi:unnamed protein product [Urochloa humidicola]